MNIAPLMIVVWESGSGISERLSAFLEKFARSQNVAKLLDGEGLTVLGDAGAPHLVLKDGSGVVWGTLFDRPTNARVTDAANVERRIPVARFLTRYWGGYLFVRSSNGSVELCREPSGAIPCYRARIDGAEIFTTRPRLLIDAGLLRPEIDWTVIAQSLIYRDLRPARTALRGIDELMPGTTATVERGAVRVGISWSPWDHATPASEIAPHDEAVERVRQAATGCVAAWGDCFERPLIELSGGLDSSIVAAILSQTSARPHCVTFASVKGDPDETPYARAVADHLGFPFEVLNPDIPAVDLTRSQAADLPRPSARAFAQAHDSVLRAAAARVGADAFFSGGGGDNVFAYLKSVLPVIDHWRRGGAGLFATINDIASVAEVSLWAVVAASVRRALRMRAAKRWMTDERFVGRAATEQLPFPHGHPWVDAPASVLPGKRVHGHAMIVIQNHLEGFDRLHDAPIISPLISQPLVETCMAIPTWLWCAGGANRAVARQALADRLPSMVIDRRTKGAFDAYCARVFDANRGVAREMLMQGMLAEQGLIDTGQIAAALAPGTVPRSEMLRLLDLADVEAWACGWSGEAISVLAP